ncbi:phage major capsid protein [Ancylobacter sp. IITR112]|uniref:phage major capsid protein n=1 Tax=Ancylobacter sp. IITR112 TaxID=3138073 RepID=UPI00352B8556
MKNIVTDRQALEMRRHSASILQKLGLRHDANFEPHTLDWSALNDCQNQVMRAARLNLDRMDGASESDGPGLEQAHEGFMALYDACEREKDWRGKLGSREARAEGGNPFRPTPGDCEARGVEDGESYEYGGGPGASGPSDVTRALRLNESFGGALRSLRGGGAAGRGFNEYRGLTPGGFLRAMVRGPQSAVERRALAESTDSAGGYTVPDVIMAPMIDRMRAASVVMRAGALTIPITSDNASFAKVATDPVPAWRAENEAAAESDPTFAKVPFAPKSLMVIVRISRELLDDSINIGTALPNVIAQAMATELDRVALMGSGSGSQPRGVANFAGLTASGYSALELANYVPLVRMRTALRTANSDATAFIMSPRDEGALAEKLDGEGNPLIIPPAIASTPRLATTSIPTNLGGGANQSLILAGDWSRLMVGIRSELRIEILKERYADYHQYAFVAHLRADIAAEHEAAFCKIPAVTLPA